MNVDQECTHARIKPYMQKQTTDQRVHSMHMKTSLREAAKMKRHASGRRQGFTRMGGKLKNEW